MQRSCKGVGLAALVMCLGCGELSAQSLNLGQKLPLAAAPTKQVASQIAMPPVEDMLGLLRTTIVALNQANQTGNYTVLRDLGAPDFSNANDASRLSLIFQVLREKAVDFTPLLQISPEVSEAPAINEQGLLRLIGFFPTEPLRVNFDMSFQSVQGHWHPYAISVYLAEVQAQLQPPPVLTKRATATVAPVVLPPAVKPKQSVSSAAR